MRQMKVYKNFMSKGFIAHIMPDLDFAITYLATYAKCDYYDLENLQVTPNVEDILPMPNAIVWNGTPSEMALLMNTLADNGYIDYPIRKNGEKNNAEEQARLNQAESAKLDKQIKELQGK